MAVKNHRNSPSPLMEQSFGKPLPAFCEDGGTPTGLSSASSSFRRSNSSPLSSLNNSILAASGFARPLPRSGYFRRMSSHRSSSSFRTPFGITQTNSILRNMSVSRTLNCPFGVSARRDSAFGPMVEEVDSDHESVIIVEPPAVMEEEEKVEEEETKKKRGTKPVYRDYMRGTACINNKKRGTFNSEVVDVHSKAVNALRPVGYRVRSWKGSGSPRPTPKCSSTATSRSTSTTSRSGSSPRAGSSTRSGSWVQKGSTWVKGGSPAVSRSASVSSPRPQRPATARARTGSIGDRLYSQSTSASRSFCSMTSALETSPAPASRSPATARTAGRRSGSVTDICFGNHTTSPITSRTSSRANLRSQSVPNTRAGSFFGSRPRMSF